jgi:hypothetical protein
LDEAPPGGWRRQWLAVALESFQPLVDDLAQLGVHPSLIIAVATGADDAWALSHEALILVGPFNDLDVSGTVVHERDSLITFFTSRC